MEIKIIMVVFSGVRKFTQGLNKSSTSKIYHIQLFEAEALEKARIDDFRKNEIWFIYLFGFFFHFI